MSAAATRWLPRGLCTALGLCAIPLAAAAQSFSGHAGGFNVQRRISYQAVVYEQTGLLVSAGGAVRLGRMQLGVSGLVGTLNGDGGTVNVDTKVRSTAVAVQVFLAPWASVAAQVEARRFEADAGVTMWRLLGGAVHLEPDLGLEGLRGLADVNVLPASSVSNGPKLKVATQATVGVTYSPGRERFLVRLAYRFERYDIAASSLAIERYEQFRGIVFEVGLRLDR